MLLRSTAQKTVYKNICSKFICTMLVDIKAQLKYLLVEHEMVMCGQMLSDVHNHFLVNVHVSNYHTKFFK
jgi:hypothetical protein